MIAKIVRYGLLLILFIFLPHGETPAVKRPLRPFGHFTDVAEQVRLREATFCVGKEREHLLESVGSGGAFVDFDHETFAE